MILECEIYVRLGSLECAMSVKLENLELKRGGWIDLKHWRIGYEDVQSTGVWGQLLWLVVGSKLL